MQNLKRELEVVFPSVGEETNLPPLPAARRSSAMLASSPEHHGLAGAASLAALGHQAAPPHHGHRRGVSVSGSGIIPNIPTAMSIGDIHSLVPAGAHGAATAVDGTTAAATTALDSRDRSKSIDQLGLTLEGLDGIGVRNDSFRFNPFGQANRIPSMHKQISASKLIPPASASAGPPPKTLETIPGGVRVTNAKPHPQGAAPPPLTPEPPVVVAAAKAAAAAAATTATVTGTAAAAATAAATATSAAKAVAFASAPASSPTARPPPVIRHATTVVIPQLLLITRNGPAKNKEQEDALEVDVTRPSDIARARSWLHGNSEKDRLDGLYMQYQPFMLEPEGIEASK